MYSINHKLCTSSFSVIREKNQETSLEFTCPHALGYACTRHHMITWMSWVLRFFPFCREIKELNDTSCCRFYLPVWCMHVREYDAFNSLVLGIGPGRAGLASPKPIMLHAVLVRSVKTVARPSSKSRRAFVGPYGPSLTRIFDHIKLKYYNHIKFITY
jgi:hypothetical protein